MLKKQFILLNKKQYQQLEEISMLPENAITTKRIHNEHEPTLSDQTNHVKRLSINLPKANRNDNYYELIMPELNNRQEQVFSAICELNRPCTMHEIADTLKVPLNTISGRFGELVTKEKIKVVGRTENRRSLYKRK